MVCGLLENPLVAPRDHAHIDAGREKPPHPTPVCAKEGGVATRMELREREIRELETIGREELREGGRITELSGVARAEAWEPMQDP